jgi:very-short-patch-repair endonuclease
MNKEAAGKPGSGKDENQAANMRELLLQNWQLVAGGLAAAVVLVVAFFSLRSAPYPYERRGVMLGPAEINFFRTLQSAVREDWIILSMVRLTDVIKVRPKTRQHQIWQSRIFGKHIDFVICDYETLEVKLAIELDDVSRRRAERKSRDRFVNTALTAAGLPLLRVKVEEKYETSAIRKDIEDALGIAKKKKTR